MKKIELPRTLPGLLRAFLIRNKIRASELSRRSGLAKPSVSLLLSGKRGAEDGTLISLAKAMNLSRQETILFILAGRVQSSKGDARQVWNEIQEEVSRSMEGSVAGLESLRPQPTSSPVDTTHIDWFNEVIHSIVKGMVQLQTIPGEGQKEPVTRRPLSSVAGRPVPPVTRGSSEPRKQGRRIREPGKIAPKVKTDPRTIKIGQPKGFLPTLRALFLFLHRKVGGVNLLGISNHFGVAQGPLKVLLGKLVRRGSLNASEGRFFLHKPLQARSTVNPVRPAPIPESAVLAFLGKTGAVTLHQMASAMGESSHHRLIKVINELKKAGKLVVEGKTYWLATFVSEPVTAPWRNPPRNIEDGSV